jgi:hypothetical protein
MRRSTPIRQVVKPPQAKSPIPPKKKKVKGTIGSMPQSGPGIGTKFLLSLIAPFDSPPAHVPDSEVTRSGLGTSIFNTAFVPFANAGAGTVHAGGFLCNPFPGGALSFFNETTVGSGIFTDLNVLGTAYANASDIPNNVAMGSAAGTHIRCVGIGVRISYEGTELNRSGNFHVGLASSNQPAQTIPATGTKASEMWPLFGGNFPTEGNIRNSLVEGVDVRVPSEGTLEFIWKPSVLPSYQSGSYVSGGIPGSIVDPSVWHAPHGGAGVQAGQHVLVVFLTGDTTSAASIAGGLYNLQVVYHWEVCPSDWSVTTLNQEASPSNSRELDMVLNNLERIPIGRQILPSGPVALPSRRRF